MKKILILGGAGFIGSKTAYALVNLGFKVLIIDNLSTGRKENIDKSFDFIKTDIGNYKKMNEIFKKFKPDYLFNFAFNVLVPKSIENPSLEIKSIKDHLNILEICKNNNTKKIIFPSTGFVYGNINGSKKIKENDLISLENPYSIAKYTAEKFTIYYNKKFNLDYTILRYAAVYGPGQVTGAMSDYIRSAKKNITCNFWGSKKTRDYVFIEDVVKANLSCLEDNSSKKIINIGTGMGTNLLKLYYKICKNLNVKPKPKFNNYIIGEQDNYKLDASFAKKAINWYPKIRLNYGLKTTIEHHIKYNL
tara:strand:+ start:158 stop:1072 length:915 start_codon:yes stop_codon:yes gene_type:complete